MIRRWSLFLRERGGRLGFRGGVQCGMVSLGQVCSRCLFVVPYVTLVRRQKLRSGWPGRLESRSRLRVSRIGLLHSCFEHMRSRLNVAQGPLKGSVIACKGCVNEGQVGRHGAESNFQPCLRTFRSASVWDICHPDYCRISSRDQSTYNRKRERG